MNDDDQPITKRDLDGAIKSLREFVLEREAALIWKVIALQVTLIGAIAGAQWVALMTVLQHWKP